MPKRAITAKQRTWLLDELSLWRRDAIVTDQQAQRIADLYEGAGELAERGRSRAVSVLMAAAATLVGLAALLLIGYNWDALSRDIKLVMVLSTIALTHALAFRLRYKQNALARSETVFFLACLFYGAGIWLVAQVFHLNAHYPDGVWWWAVERRPSPSVSRPGCCTSCWSFSWRCGPRWRSSTSVTSVAWLFGRWDFIPNGAYSLPLLALPGILGPTASSR